MTKGEEAFLDQKTRQLLVDWASHDMVRGPWRILPEEEDNIFLQHAVAKKWVSVKEDDQGKYLNILSTGFHTAARFLKR